MKNLLKVLLLLALAAYLVMAFTNLNKPDTDAVCKRVEIVVEDSARAGFIHSDEVIRILRAAKLYPQGKRMDFVDSRKIEQALRKNPFIEEALCYKTAANSVRIQLSQRLPVMRIMSEDGSNYYIDNKGRVMPQLTYPADLVVATGQISPEYARKYLVGIGKFLQEDAFWNDQIVQLHVDGLGHIELIPRVGDHLVYMGPPTDFRHKLGHLKVFYDKVLNVVGWNKYSLISLEFNNQIICKKK